MDPVTTEEKTQNLPKEAELKAEDKVLTGAAHTTETPDWLKEASGEAEAGGEIVEPVVQVESEKKEAQAPIEMQIKEEKPSATEIGEDPNSEIVTNPSMEVVDKADKDAAKKMDKVGLDPSTGRPTKGEKISLMEKFKGLFSFSSKKATPAKAKDGGKGDKSSLETSPANMNDKERKVVIDAEKIYQEGLASIKDLIAPASMEIEYDKLRMDGMWVQSFYVFSYPRYLDVNWLAPVVNFDVTMDISQFVYPISSGDIMRTLKKKVAQMQSSMRINAEKGQVRDPALETALEDADQLRTEIQRGQEKFFQFALYFTLYSEDKKKLEKSAKQLESLLAGKLVMTKRAQIQAEHALNSSLPLCLDELYTIRNMNTGPLSTTFPFTSSDLTSDKGILYGVNRHNDSLIIFDRFALENANSVVFAKSGAGKSYGVKLEILRLMMMGTDVIVIDPENEYEALANTVGGSYLRLSLNSDRRINPFDLPKPVEGDDIKPGDLLRSAVINLHGLMKLMLGNITPEEESILDMALIDVYALKGITMDVLDPSVYEPPTMEDLHQVLSSMEGATSLVQRISKYTVGSYAGIFNKPTNVDLSSGMMVFCIRELEDALRPIAMYIVLNHIWNRVRSELKKRVLVIDEAWSMMQHEDSAKFLFGLVKRARKYYLGVTTITQDVEDFVKSEYGKPIITNSSMQLLLKQAPSAVETLAKIFNLTQGEKYVLLNSGVGQGLFFAGLKHVAVQIIASYTEDKIVTTDPEKILQAREDESGDLAPETPSA
jgi:conjugal transfer ATP-binding protein TraC